MAPLQKEQARWLEPWKPLHMKACIIFSRPGVQQQPACTFQCNSSLWARYTQPLRKGSLPPSQAKATAPEGAGTQFLITPWTQSDAVSLLAQNSLHFYSRYLGPQGALCQYLGSRIHTGISVGASEYPMSFRGVFEMHDISAIVGLRDMLVTIEAPAAVGLGPSGTSQR